MYCVAEFGHFASAGPYELFHYAVEPRKLGML